MVQVRNYSPVRSGANEKEEGNAVQIAVRVLSGPAGASF